MQLQAFSTKVHEFCLDKFGQEGRIELSTKTKKSNRRQVQKGQLRAHQGNLKKQLKSAKADEQPGIQILLDDIKKMILVLSRAENQCNRRRKK